MAAATDTLLSVDRLVKRFGGLTATDNVSLDVRRGEIHAIIGPNGAGKTTLVAQLAGEIIPNGGTIPVTSNDPLFRGITLPPRPAGGQAQVIVTKSLLIYGTGRSGGVPNAPTQIFAVDKATGKQVGAVEIPSRTSAVPMTFMHKGKQYIVFATGAGSNTSLVALRLPAAQ
jgi:energy-coupling factor transporter ATP-binding protein EcfA2